MDLESGFLISQSITAKWALILMPLVFNLPRMKRLDVPSSSAYINFLEIAGKVESVDTTKVLKASAGVIEKIKQQTKA